MLSCKYQQQTQTNKKGVVKMLDFVFKINIPRLTKSDGSKSETVLTLSREMGLGSKFGWRVKISGSWIKPGSIIAWDTPKDYWRDWSWYLKDTPCPTRLSKKRRKEIFDMFNQREFLDKVEKDIKDFYNLPYPPNK